MFGTTSVEIKKRDDGEILFCCADIAKAMGLSESAMRSKVAQLDSDEKQQVSKERKVGLRAQKATMCTEAGLYKLILWTRDSKTTGTACHKFTRWVTHTVLPSIRKTGQYKINELQQAVERLKIEKAERTAELDELADTLEERTNDLDETKAFLTDNRYHHLGRDVLLNNGVHKDDVYGFLNRHSKGIRKELTWIKKTPYVRSGREDVVRDYLTARVRS
jgi:prophage antirepressor-like protein